MTRTAINQPASEDLAVAAESARNQVGRIGFYLESRPGQFTPTREQMASGAPRQLCRYVFHRTSAETRNRFEKRETPGMEVVATPPCSTNPEISSSI
jgi:hypothetical protein